MISFFNIIIILLLFEHTDLSVGFNINANGIQEVLYFILPQCLLGESHDNSHLTPKSKEENIFIFAYIQKKNEACFWDHTFFWTLFSSQALLLALFFPPIYHYCNDFESFIFCNIQYYCII